MKKHEFRELVDQSLSELVWDERQRRAVLRAIEKEERPVRKVSMSVILVAAMLCLSVTALAAGLLFSRTVDEVALADKALEEAYGVTPAMQSFFTRQTADLPDGGLLVVYTGSGEFHAALGEYTVTVKNGRCEVVWTHDGISTEGGFDAEAWGAEQLSEMVRISGETHSVLSFREKAIAIAQAHGEMPERSLTSEELEANNARFDAASKEIEALARFSTDELSALAREAVETLFPLTTEQLALLEYTPELSGFAYDAEAPCWAGYFWLAQDQQPDEQGMTLWQDGDGFYIVYVNVQTGVIENALYDSALAGNG